jgi:UDP-N-acetylglucosamine 4,6-dehydratase
MILVTGGTGSFGHAYVKRHYGKLPIRVLSRDEEKQRQMVAEFPDVDFVIGDVRDRESVNRAMRDVTQVFHAAALKQVPSCESAPLEAIRTNAIGTDNVCAAAKDAGARVVLLSTDKAVEPVGVMGATKMLAENIATNHGFNVVRYGNVIGSRGSIVPIFRQMVAEGRPITITDPEMTRFLITMQQAMWLLDLAMEQEPLGIVYVPELPAATVEQMARCIAPGHPTEIVGFRPGEKKHELLVAPDEFSDHYPGGYHVVYPGEPGGGWTSSSETAPRLTDAELTALLP